MDQEWYIFIKLIDPIMVVFVLPAVLICYGVLRFQHRKRDRLTKDAKAGRLSICGESRFTDRTAHPSGFSEWMERWPSLFFINGRGTGRYL